MPERGSYVEPEEVQIQTPFVGERPKRMGRVARYAIPAVALVSSLSARDSIAPEMRFSEPIQGDDVAALAVSENDHIYEPATITQTSLLHRIERFHAECEAQDEPTNERVHTLALDYLALRRIVVEEGEKELRVNNSEAALAYIDQLREEHILAGVCIAQELENGEDIELDRENGVVSIVNIRDFRLDDTTDQILLEQYLYYHMIQEISGNAEAKIADMAWLLRREDVPVTFERDGFVFATDDSLLTMSRFYQELLPRGFAMPRSIRFVSLEEAGGYKGSYNDDLQEIKLSPRADPETIIHELVHHDDSTYEILGGHEEFGAVVNYSHDHVFEMQVGEDAYVERYAMVDRREDWPETVAHYFVHGDRFRSDTEKKRETDPEVYAMRTIRYELVKQAFGGREFSKYGVAVIDNER